jgi:cytochrome bd-type quinol oxidase subunit 1
MENLEPNGMEWNEKYSMEYTIRKPFSSIFNKTSWQEFSHTVTVMVERSSNFFVYAPYKFLYLLSIFFLSIISSLSSFR